MSADARIKSDGVPQARRFEFQEWHFRAGGWSCIGINTNTFHALLD